MQTDYVCFHITINNIFCKEKAVVPKDNCLLFSINSRSCSLMCRFLKGESDQKEQNWRRGSPSNPNNSPIMVPATPSPTASTHSSWYQPTVGQYLLHLYLIRSQNPCQAPTSPFHSSQFLSSSTHSPIRRLSPYMSFSSLSTLIPS